MRTQLLKSKSTKAERRFAEALKRARVPFRYGVRMGSMEIDFLVGSRAIEINGHPQNVAKNRTLAAMGLVPLHFTNQEIASMGPDKLQRIVKHYVTN